MYLCVCILRVSLRCSKWLIEPGREQYFVLSRPLAPLCAQVCSQPWFLLPGNSRCCKRPCRGRGAGWGYMGGLFQLPAWVRASSYLWGALSMHAANVHVPQNGQKCPNSWFLQTARPTANAVREKPLQKWIFFLPLFSAHPWCGEMGHAVAWRPCPCPGCPGGALAAPRCAEAPPPPLSNAAPLGLSQSPGKMKHWFRLKGQR